MVLLIFLLMEMALYCEILRTMKSMRVSHEREIGRALFRSSSSVQHPT